MTDTYELFQKGRTHLRSGRPAQATVSLERAKRREPASRSIREALGIAYFRLGRWEEAAAEFQALVDLTPTTSSPTARSAVRSRSRDGRGGRPALQARPVAAAAERRGRRDLGRRRSGRPRDLGGGRHAFQAELDGCVRDGAHTCFGRHTLDLLAASA